MVTKDNWKSCGYIGKSKNEKVLIVMVKHTRFIVNVSGVKDVLDGKVEYTEIFEHIEGDKANV